MDIDPIFLTEATEENAKDGKDKDNTSAPNIGGVAMDLGSNTVQQEQHIKHQQMMSILESSLPENRFELELEFIQALASPAYIHFLATSSSLTMNGETTTTSEIVNDPSLNSAVQSSSSSPFQQLQPFLHYLYNTYSQPEYARFLRYPHALYFLESLLSYEDKDDTDNSNNQASDKTEVASSASPTISAVETNNNNQNTNKIWIEWTIPSFRNFCHQQQFLAWQYRHATYYGVGSCPTSTGSPSPLMTTQDTSTANHDAKNDDSPTHNDDDDDDDDIDDNGNVDRDSKQK